MYIVTDSIQCSGCSACSMVCPTRAIEMLPDAEGFKIPKVNYENCVDCALCLHVCPAKNPITREQNGLEAYAAKWENDVRKCSASGAFFPAVAKFILEAEHGYVCGCVLNNDDMMPEHIVSNQWPDVQRMQDSKYVQSDMKDCYYEIGKLLKENETVMFTGTSCQVAGLYSYLAVKHISDSKLFTIDFFCHGVPSPIIWGEYLRFYENEKGRKPIAFRFRSKRYGWGGSSHGSSFLNSITYHNVIQMEKLDNVSWASRMWRMIFFSNLCIRSYCHSCPYASIEKPADLTMGDFWGVEKFYPEFDDGKGCSMVLARTEKARMLIHKIEWLTYKKVSVCEVIEKQANAVAPSATNPQRAKFWNDYNKNGFSFCARKYFHYTSKDRAKALLRRVLFALKLKNIYD